MIVSCSKCQMKLKISDDKVSSEGTRFKCPKCSTVFLVKKPAVQIKPLGNKIVAAHENPAIVERIGNILAQNGFTVITAHDGIDAMIKAIKELPFLAILDVALPKIYGFEVCKRLKERAETKEIKVILISSIYDKNRYRREPVSLHGADDYIDEHQIEVLLLEKINALKEPVKEVEEKPKEPVSEEPQQKMELPAREEAPAQTEAAGVAAAQAKKEEIENDAVEKARRLARTIVSDIYLYSSNKMDEVIKNNAFYKEFASEIREGTKLYEGRIPKEVRNKGDFFREAIENFIESKKKNLKV